MIASSEEVARSLAGAWELLQRRPTGLRRLDFTARGFYHSFWSVPLAAPAFVTVLAAERAHNTTRRLRQLKGHLRVPFSFQ